MPPMTCIPFLKSYCFTSPSPIFGKIHNFIHLPEQWSIDMPIYSFLKSYPCSSPTQPAFTCSKLTIEALEQAVKYVQS